MLSITVVVNILAVQVSVMILLILLQNLTVLTMGALNKKFRKAFCMTFRKASTHKVVITDRKSMPYCLFSLLLQ